MTDTPVQVKQLSLDEFVRLYEQQPFELVDGEQIPLSPTVAGHNDLTEVMNWHLTSLAKPRGLGRVFVEAPFVLEYSKRWVKGSRTPDLMYFTMERLESYIANNPDWRSKPFVLVPDLAIEIVSQTDSYSDVEAKAEGYLRDGVRLVWILDPQRKRIAVHEAGSSVVRVLSTQDKLTGGDVIPDFEIDVVQIFG